MNGRSGVQHQELHEVADLGGRVYLAKRLRRKHFRTATHNKGQYEAARSLGMPGWRAMVTIVIPQALRIVLPPLTNEVILLTKDSSLVYLLGMGVGQYDVPMEHQDRHDDEARPDDVLQNRPFFPGNVFVLQIRLYKNASALRRRLPGLGENRNLGARQVRMGDRSGGQQGRTLGAACGAVTRPGGAGDPL